jgi:hypothetical protein
MQSIRPLHDRYQVFVLKQRGVTASEMDCRCSVILPFKYRGLGSKSRRVVPAPLGPSEPRQARQEEPRQGGERDGQPAGAGGEGGLG